MNKMLRQLLLLVLLFGGCSSDPIPLPTVDRPDTEYDMAVDASADLSADAQVDVSDDLSLTDSGADAQIDADLGSDMGSQLTHQAIVNLRPAFTDFSNLTPWIKGISHIRVWGGSRGMATYPTLEAVPDVLLQNPNRFNLVQDEEIANLLALQTMHGVKTIYLININDSLESQLAFVQRLMDEGLDLDFVELGNELYLRKFAEGDLTGLGVTRAWSVEQYIDEIIDVWTLAFKELGLPVYIVGASHGTDDSNSTMYRQNWNSALVSALATRPGLVDGVTFHRYGGEERTGETHEEIISNESFQFLQTFGALPIAITESGYFFTEMTPENLELAAEFWTAFRAALKPNDHYGVHVMQRSGMATGDLSYGLYDDNGLSPVGARFDAWLKTGE